MKEIVSGGNSGGRRPKNSSSRTFDEIREIFSNNGYRIEENQEFSSSKKMLAYTEEGYKIEANTGRMLEGRKPHVIGADNPHTIWNIKNIWLPLNAPDYELLSDEYVNNKALMIWKLKNSHLEEFRMCFNNFKNLKRHPTIGRIMGSESKKKSTQEVIEFIENKIKSQWKSKKLKMTMEEDYEYSDGNDIIFFTDDKGYVYCQSVKQIYSGYSVQRHSRKYQELADYNIRLWNKMYNKNEKFFNSNEIYIGDGKYKFHCEEHGEFEKYLYDAFDGVRCRKCTDFETRGEAHPRWKESYEEGEREKRRTIFGYGKWRRDVYERDGYACVKCASEDNLCAHHKDAYCWSVDRRIDITNGVTLCKECHVSGDNAFHKIFTSNHTTEYDYNYWIKNY